MDLGGAVWEELLDLGGADWEELLDLVEAHWSSKLPLQSSSGAAYLSGPLRRVCVGGSCGPMEGLKLSSASIYIPKPANATPLMSHPSGYPLIKP